MRRAIFLLPIMLLSRPSNMMAQENSFAVVELFTSEGCSSCPRGEQTVEEMTKLIRKEGKHVLTLAFHITYFNHLGWVDPYSTEANTNRQKKYSVLNVKGGIYTPQVVVNGKHEFVGSSPVAFRRAVDVECLQRTTFKIETSASLSNDSIAIEYSVNGRPGDKVINIALIENSVERTVTRGENKNRVLRHMNVVREFQTYKLTKQNKHMLVMPSDLACDNCTLIIYVQNRKNMAIEAATEIHLN